MAQDIPGDWNGYQQDPFSDYMEAPPDNPNTTARICVNIPKSWLRYIVGGIHSLTTPDRWIGELSEKLQYASWVEDVINDLLTPVNCSEVVIMGGFVGQIIKGFWASCPDNCLPMDGRTWSKETYADLWAVLSATGNSQFDYSETHFILPNAALQTFVGDGVFNTNIYDEEPEGTPAVSGNYAGEKEHTLSITEMPSHRHDVSYDSSRAYAVNDVYVDAGRPGTQFLNGGTSYVGGGQPHNNMQPSIVAKHCIVYKVDNLMSHTFQLRQNSSNPYLLEQQIDGGSWSLAFDYKKIKQKCPPTAVVTNEGDVYTYITDINNQYDGSVTSIYNDAVYDGGGTDDDYLRNGALCYALWAMFQAVQESINARYDEKVETKSFLDMLEDTVGWVTEQAGLFLTAAELITFIAYPPATVLIAGLYAINFNKTAENLTDEWGEFFAGDKPTDTVEYTNDLVCAVYNQLKDTTISQSSLTLAIINAMAPDALDTPFNKIIKGYLVSMYSNTVFFPAFLNQLQLAYTAQKAGVIFDQCPCPTTYVIDVDFRTASSIGPFTLAENTIFDVGVGARNIAGMSGPSRTAGVFVTLPFGAILNELTLVYRSPRNDNSNHGTVYGDGVQLLDVSEIPVGEYTASVTGLNVAVSELRYYGDGSGVTDTDGLIYRARAVYTLL